MVQGRTKNFQNHKEVKKNLAKKKEKIKEKKLQIKDRKNVLHHKEY